MRIQVFSEYLRQAQAGKVDFLACPMHEEDKPVIFELVHNERDGRIVLQCFACGYKNYPGITLYNNLLDRLAALEQE